MGDQWTTVSQTPTEGEVLAALSVLSEIGPLRRSHSLRKLLNYIVSMTLKGEERNLKAYTIAVEALGRGPSFDATSDPIVRVEARRLRKVLNDYYSGDGNAAPVRILLPKGRYVPVFVYRESAVPDRSLVNRRSTPHDAPRVQLVFHRQDMLDELQGSLANNVESGIIDAVTRFSFIHLTYPPGTAEGSTAPSPDFRINLHFKSAGPGGALICQYQVWEAEGWTVICQDAPMLANTSELERLLGGMCARVFGCSGCLHRHNLALMLSGKTFPSRYECKLRYLDVVRSHGDQGRESAVRQMIEAQLQWDFGFAHGYAFLSHLLFRKSLGALPAEYDDLMLRSLHLALRATELSSDSAFVYTNLYRTADVRGDQAIAHAALASALRLNPYDDDILLARGARLICGGHPAYGVELIEARLSAEIPHPSYYLLYLGLGKFLMGDMDGLLEYGLRVPVDVRTGAESAPGALLISVMKGRLAGNDELAADAAAAMRKSLAQIGIDLSTFLARIITHEPSRRAVEQASRIDPKV